MVLESIVETDHSLRVNFSELQGGENDRFMETRVKHVKGGEGMPRLDGWYSWKIMSIVLWE